jgi:uncharacterized phiE125 gp8 family phage protein
VQSITSVIYVDTDGQEQTLSADLYEVDIASDPGWIVPAASTRWPRTMRTINAVRVRFVAGYGDPEDVPEKIKTAIKALVAHWYEAREPVAIGVTANEVPLHVGRLINQAKLWVAA